MRYKNKVSSFLLLLTLAFSSLSCEKQQASNNSISNSNTVTAPTVKAQSPTEAYKMLYAAVKAKDKATIRQLMSKGSLGMGEMLAGQQKKSIDQVLENGFVAPTLAPSITEIRDERIKGNIGLIEVRNEQEKKWEDLPFVLEDGSWKLAIGDIFSNAFDPNQTLPKGKGQMEASNKGMPMPSNVTKFPGMTDNANKPSKIPSDGTKSVEAPKEKKP